MADIELMIDDVNRVIPVTMPKKYESSALNVLPFIKRLNAVTEPHRVFNEVVTDASLNPGQTAVSALWIPKYELPENGSRADVRIIWHLHPSTRRLSMSPLKWSRRRSYFWSRVGHEIVHRHQAGFRSPDGDARNYRTQADDRDVREDQQYLGNYDELEAHAYDAAFEMASWCPGATFTQALKSIYEIHGNTVIPTYTTYIMAFPPAHPAILPFQRKVRAWWEQIQKSPEFYARLALPRLI